MARILQVVPLLGYGGVERALANIYIKITKSEFHFDIVTHGKTEPMYSEIFSECNIYEVQTIGNVGFRQYYQQLRNRVDIPSYDIVHIHLGHLTGVYALIYKLLGAKKIICHAHTTSSPNPKHRWAMPVLRLLPLWMADTRIACGNDAGKFCFGKNYIVVRNGIDYKPYENVRDAEVKSLRRELQIQDDIRIIGHVGNFTWQKNHRFIIDLFSKIIEKSPKTVLVLVGSGELEEDIRSYVSIKKMDGKVLFCENRDDIPLFMHAFNLCLLPSISEGLPLTGIEAQLSGNPCLFSDSIDAQVDMQFGNLNFLSLKQTMDTWESKINNLLESKDAQVSKELIEKKFETSEYNITIVANTIAKLYRELSK